MFPVDDQTLRAFEDEMEELAEDRLRLLEVLGFTEHEWACRGGRKFAPFARLTEAKIPDDSFEVDVDAPLPEVFREPPPIPAEALVPPLPPGVPVTAITFYAETVEGVVEDAIIWTDEQRAALDAIDEWYERSYESFYSLTGPAGCGKSTLLREVVARYPSATLTAMTGKAALRLSQVAGCGAGTLHAAMYWPPKPGEDLRFTRLREPPSGLVLCDEASMMSPGVFAHLQQWGVRALLVGDSYQLPPVITGEELRQHGEDYSVFSHVSGAELKTVMRNAGGVLRAATKVRLTGEICEESDLDAPGDGYEFARDMDPMARAIDEYMSARESTLLITWKNATRMNTNRKIRGRLGHEGPLPDEGEPVLVKRNGQGHLNGEIVTCDGFEAGPLIGSVRTLWMKSGGQRLLVSFEGGNPEKGGEPFDGQMPWIVDFKRFHIDLKNGCYPEPLPVTWAYCISGHSSQGSQADRAIVFLERSDLRNQHFRKPTTLPSGEQVRMSARWCYTSQTRAVRYSMMVVGR